MKVVLKKAVVRLGVPGDIVKVADGFAANWLIPQGIALHANKKNLAEFESKKHELMKIHEDSKLKAIKIKEAIEGKAVSVIKPINDAGNLYAVIHASDIAVALNETFKELNFEFDKGQVTVSNKIRNYGVYDFSLMLYNGVVAKLKFSVNRTKDLAEEALKPKTPEVAPATLEPKPEKKPNLKPEGEAQPSNEAESITADTNTEN